MKVTTPPPIPSRSGEDPGRELEALNEDTAAALDEIRKRREAADREADEVLARARGRREKLAAEVRAAGLKETDRLRAELEELEEQTPARIAALRSQTQDQEQREVTKISGAADAKRLDLLSRLHAAELRERELFLEETRKAEGDAARREAAQKAAGEAVRRREARMRRYLVLAFVERAKALREWQTAASGWATEPSFVRIVDGFDYRAEVEKLLPEGSRWAREDQPSEFLPAIPHFALP